MNSCEQKFGILPVRPRPMDDESFIGYVLRVASFNGRKTISALCDAIGLPRRNLNRGLGPRDNLFRGLLTALNLGGTSIIDKIAHKEAEHYDESRSLKSTKVEHPKICVKCISESAYFKESWQKIHITHCDKHNLVLIDECPCCKKELIWHANIFERCPFCETSWGNVSVPTSREYEYQLLDTNRNSLRALIDTFVITLRPWDLMHNDLSSINIPNRVVHVHMQQAFALLTDKRFREKWVSHYRCKEFPFAKRMFQHLEVADFFELRQLPSSVQSAATFDNLLESEVIEAISTRRKKLAKEDKDLRAQMGIIEAAQFLRMQKSDLYILKDNGLCNTLKEEELERHFLFDVTDVNRINAILLSKAIFGNVEHNLSPLRQVQEKLGYFGISIGKLLCLLAESDIEIYVTESATHWHEIYVDPFVFFKWLESIFHNLLPDIITPTIIFKIAGLNWDQYLTVVKFENQNAALNGTRFIHSATMVDFFNKYVVLNRIAYIHSQSTKLLHDMLEANSLQPKYRLDDRKIVYIYDNHPSSIDIIDRCIRKLSNR